MIWPMAYCKLGDSILQRCPVRNIDPLRTALHLLVRVFRIIPADSLQFCYLRHKNSTAMSIGIAVCASNDFTGSRLPAPAFAVVPLAVCRIFEEQRQIQRGFPLAFFS
ncbi:hypothetical protein KCP71_19830 [Salmonella enterica subsp. enterica]|nr:hypothetical protein KCP71_19830 [Salmonella enterica subsp. enterica]